MNVLSLSLDNGAVAFVSLSAASTAIAIGEDVLSFDLTGRPYAVVRGGRTWRRGLDGGWRPSVDSERLLVWVHGAVHRLERRARALPPSAERADLVARLEAFLALTPALLDDDARRFGEIYTPIGVLPPDQYLARVVQVTHGCSWNRCTFCSLYAHTPFRIKTAEELAEHVDAVAAFLGSGLYLRRSVFLGDANALCIPHDRLVELLRVVVDRFPVVARHLSLPERVAWFDDHPAGVSGLYSFLDVWTGARKTPAMWSEYAALGLRRVYVGLESGDPDLLQWLEKPSDVEAVADVTAALHGAGVSVGIIVLVGAGGARFAESHVSRTTDLLRRLGLTGDDLVYLSEILAPPDLEYARRSSRDGVLALAPDECARQARRIVQAVRTPGSAHAPRVVKYDLRRLVY